MKSSELMTCWSGSSPAVLRDANKGQSNLFSLASEIRYKLRNRKDDEKNAGNVSHCCMYFLYFYYKSMFLKCNYYISLCSTKNRLNIRNNFCTVF